MPLSEITWFVIDDFVLVNVEKKSVEEVNSNTRVMMRLVKEICNKHELLMTSINNRIDVVNLPDIVQEMMKDGKENWGRVVTVFAVCAKKLQSSKKHETEVRDYLIKYMYSREQDWDGFMRKFEQKVSWKEKIMEYIGYLM